MKLFEKLTIAALVIPSVVATAIYGVWLEKVLFVAPLLMLIYLSVAIWMARGNWRAGRRIWRSEVSESPQAVKSETTADSSQRTTHSTPQQLASHSTSCTPHPTMHGSLRLPPGGIMLLLFWLYSAVMIPFSVLPYEAKTSVLRFGGYLLVYWASANLLSRFPARKVVWLTLFVLLFFVACYSLAQHKVAPDQIFGMERYTRYWTHGRLGGTYQCPNHIAHLYQMWIPLCCVFLFLPQFGWFWRICFAYAVPMFLLLIYQTQSRAGLLGMVAALGMTVLLLILGGVVGGAIAVRRGRRWSLGRFCDVPHPDAAGCNVCRAMPFRIIENHGV